MTLTKFTLMGLGNSDAFPQDIEEFKRQYSLNTGNLLFNYAAKLICDLAPGRFGWGAKSSILNKSCQGLLIPMANQLGEHVDLSVSGPRLEGVEIPIAILGIGAQSNLNSKPILPDGSKEWLAKASSLKKSSAANISTRGQSSTMVIQENVPAAHSIPLGCPSNLISSNRILGESIGRRLSKANGADLRIAVSAGNPYLKGLADLEVKLMNIVEETSGIYIVQHPQALLSLSLGFGVEDKARHLIQERFFPDKSDREMVKWMNLYSAVFTSVTQWMLSLRHFDLHVGTRIHGSQAALQAGVPSVCLYIDSRTRELCEQMQIPHAPATEFSQEASVARLLEILSQWDWGKYDQNRMSNAAATLEFLSSNYVRPSQHLIDLAEA